MSINKGGAPDGNQNAARAAVARQALIKALERRSLGDASPLIERMSVLVDIWDKQITNALSGDYQSATMIVDRLDGKPKQAVVGGDEDDSPLKVVTRIELVPMNGRSSD